MFPNTKWIVSERIRNVNSKETGNVIQIRKPVNKHPIENAGQGRNVIQIRMLRRGLELRYVPVSFFVNKFQEKR